MKRAAAILALMLGVALMTQVHAALDLAQMEQLLIDHQALHDGYNEDMEAVQEALADGDLTTAKNKATDAKAKLMQADALVALAKLDGLPLNIAGTTNVLTDSGIWFIDLLILQIDQIDTVIKTKSQLATSAVGAAFRAARANNYLQRSDRRFNRVSLVATGPSLHTAGKKLCWTVQGIPAGFKGVSPASSCPLEAVFVNPQESNFIEPIESLVNDNPCSGRVCFVMGRDLGGGHIKIVERANPTNVLGRRLVFNYGSNTDSNGTPRFNPITMAPLATLSGVSQFAGTYTGTYTGSCNITSTSCGGPASCGNPSGTFNSTISTAGKIAATVGGDADGSGTGTMSPLGLYGTGSIGVQFMGFPASAAFKGGVLNTRFNNCAIAKGTWTAKNSCGNGSGTWTAERTDCP